MPYSNEYLRFPSQLGEALHGWAEGGMATVRFALPSVASAFALRQQIYAFVRACKAHRKEPEAAALYDIGRRLSLGVHLPGSDKGVPKGADGPADLVFFSASNGRWAEALDELSAAMGRKNLAKASEAAFLEKLKGEAE